MTGIKKTFAYTAVLALFAFGIAHAADAPKITAYPLKTCLVSGDKLGGDMGAPVVLTNGTREIKLCCKGCQQEFEKDTAKFIKKLDDAEKKAKQP